MRTAVINSGFVREIPFSYHQESKSIVLNCSLFSASKSNINSAKKSPYTAPIKLSQQDVDFLRSSQYHVPLMEREKTKEFIIKKCGGSLYKASNLFDLCKSKLRSNRIDDEVLLDNALVFLIYEISKELLTIDEALAMEPIQLEDYCYLDV